MSKFKDKKRIGEGGFGEVWKCERVVDGAVFARKKLTNADPGEADRFQREVRILASLDHPNVVKVISKSLDAGAPNSYVMPIYQKSLDDDLSKLVGDEPRIHVIFTSILDAVEYAHGQGVLHRDLKPSNVLMNSDTDLVVSDFGHGRILDSKSTRQTLTGDRLGTLAYVAPEQFKDAKRADVRSDVFSLGRMLYELYTNDLTPAPPDLDQLPPGISVIVRRATQTRPEDRYQTVGEMKKAWANVIDTTNLETESEELGLVRAQLGASGSVTKELVARFVELLAKRLPNDDLLHESIMQLHPKAVLFMYRQDAGLTRDWIDKFCTFTGNQGWGFTYTDQIGHVCRELHQTLPDALVRAALVECVMKVGLDHNRYFVMDIMDALLLATTPAEDAVVAERLERGVATQQLRAVAERINLSKVPIAVRRVLDGAIAASR